LEANIVHLETRKMADKSIDVLLQTELSPRNAQLLVDKLKAFDFVESVESEERFQKELVEQQRWFPTHISDMDKCNHLVLKFQPELATDHPGFHDPEYRKRRVEISELAFTYRHGETLPTVNYTEQETATWKHAFTTLTELYKDMACEEQVRAIEMLQKDGIYCADKIPQLQQVSDYMKRTTGFRLRPVAGLLSARDFLASLAFRVFQCTQYIRHHSKPLHTPEPDCVHELLGHVPMLCDREFSEFSQEIGLASLAASDEDIEKLATVYWFTVEFGLCRQKGQLKAMGAGLLSAYGELKHALSDAPEHREFDADKASLTPYRDEDYQSVYYVAQSIQDMKEKVREYSINIKRPFHVRYDPYRERIEILNNKENVCHLGRLIRHELDNMERAMNILMQKKEMI